MMKRYIHIQKKDREFIAKSFGITEQSVLNAIKFDAKRGHTDLAKKVRKLAMERGGIIMIEAPEWETLHDSDGYMRQYLGDDVYKKGAKVRRFEHVMISDIQGIQDWAATLR